MTPYGLTKYRPNARIFLKDPYPSDLWTDQDGFVLTGRKKPLNGSEKIIMVFGGSSIEGRGASSNASTLAGCLEEILLARGKNIRVLNAGVCGHLSYQEAGYLDELRQRWDPFIVISIDGRNDAFYAANEKHWKPNWQSYYDQVAQDVNKMMTPNLGILSSIMENNSSAAYFFKKAVGNLRPGQAKKDIKKPDLSRIETAALWYDINQCSMQLKCQKTGIKYFAFLQPILIPAFKENMTPQEQAALIKWLKRNYPQGYPEAMETFYAQARKRLLGKPWFFDLSKIFYNVSHQVYWDSCHYADEGNRLMAQKIADVLLKNVGNW